MTRLVMLALTPAPRRFRVLKRVAVVVVVVRSSCCLECEPFAALDTSKVPPRCCKHTRALQEGAADDTCWCLFGECEHDDCDERSTWLVSCGL